HSCSSLSSLPTRRSSDLHLAAPQLLLRGGEHHAAQHIPLGQDGGHGVQKEAPVLVAQGDAVLAPLVLIDLPPLHEPLQIGGDLLDRKSTRLNSSHVSISY